MKLALLAPIGFLAVARAAVGGPFSNENGGLAPGAVVWRAWAASVVGTTQPQAGSGGYARDDLGLASSVSNAVLGKPQGFTIGDTTRHVYSLGNGGSITLGFDTPIHDGPGSDFAVFENGFTDATDVTGTSREGATNSFSFAELAHVEVATATSAWARFPSAYLATGVLHNLNSLDEDRFASQDVSLTDGLAGKHAVDYGTPFDLAALTNDPAVLSGSVRLDCIHYVRLIDAVGDGSTTDSSGRAIFDPYYHYQNGYPEAAPAASTDGFDLRGVGVIHVADVIVSSASRPSVSWYAAGGAVYQLEYADVALVAWQPLGSPVTGAYAWVAVEDSSGAVSRAYRVKRWGALP